MMNHEHPAAARDEGEQPEWREKEDTDPITSDDEGCMPLPSKLHPPLAIDVELLRRQVHHHHPPARTATFSDSNHKSQPQPQGVVETKQKSSTEQPQNECKHLDRSFGNVYQPPVVEHLPLVLPSNWLEDSVTIDITSSELAVDDDDDKPEVDLSSLSFSFRRARSLQHRTAVKYHSADTQSGLIFRNPRIRRKVSRREAEGDVASGFGSAEHVSTRHNRDRDRIHKSSRRKHPRKEEPSMESCGLFPPDIVAFQNALLPPIPPPPPLQPLPLPPLQLPSILEDDDGCSMY